MTLAVPGVFEAGSRAVFWAHTPGAFVDLAADLSYTLQAPRSVVEHPSGPGDANPPTQESVEVTEVITLDADLPPEPQTSGVTGLDERSAINYAIGVLIAQGYEPDDAKQKLRRDADSTGQPIAQVAAQLVTRAGDPKG